MVDPSTRTGERRAVLQQQALEASSVAFTITDPRQDDNPLVWVNPAFTATTGYGLSESVGRNCRFLQGPATDRTEVAKLAAHIDAGEPCTVVLLNYRRDGTTFWNELTINPVFDDEGLLINFVGAQSDVTDRIRADIDRDRAQTAERAARQRLSLVAEATGALVSTLDVRDALRRLAELVVPSLGDWVCFTTADHDEVTDVVTYHRDGHEALLGRLAELLPGNLSRHSLIRSVLERGEPIRVERIDPDALSRQLDDPELVGSSTSSGSRQASTSLSCRAETGPSGPWRSSPGARNGSGIRPTSRSPPTSGAGPG